MGGSQKVPCGFQLYRPRVHTDLSVRQVEDGSGDYGGVEPLDLRISRPRKIGGRRREGPLIGNSQRFTHWGNGHLSATRLGEALHRSEGYFELGNHYAKWFDKYAEFLDALNVSFLDGKACHTDYVTPFATRVRISRCKSAAAFLECSGFQYWLEVLERCPRVELIFGHGRGWRRIEEHFRITLENIPTPFDAKGKQGRHLSFARATLPKSKRSVLVYWWHQNFSGMPLCSLKPEERRQMGRLISKHVQRIAPRSDIARWARSVRD